MTSAWICTSPRRGWPSESNAPALISDSTVRLLQATGSTLRRKSAKSANRPLALRVRTSESTTLAADVADRAEPEADVGAARGEVAVGVVDVGRQHLQPHPPAFLQVDGGLVLVVAHAGEQRRHVLGRVVRLQEGGPVRHQPVAGAVRLVERVVGERDEDVPERLDRRVAEALAFMPSLNGMYSLSRISRFFLPIARRSRSAAPSV